ncbi:M23 family metallopeptidase [Acetobacteraceae bacterium H6797]|nr:M23 family metallopeptidase [Acetobacteraceae bacterium H6797]
MTTQPHTRRALLGAGAALALARKAAAAPESLAFAREPAQGMLVTGRTAPGTRLALDGRNVRVSPAGDFAFGFGRDAGPQASLHITHPDGRAETRSLAIHKREWRTQRINGLPERMVTPPDEVMARIRAEQERLNATRRVDTPEAWFAEGFLWPVHGPISGVYGSQRILNGQPRAPHLGLDIAAPTGSTVVAPATARVALVGDLYFTGNTVILDHGHGVATFHAHLSRVDVREGDHLPRGTPFGAVGATGRVTGPHLHLGLFWFSTSLDIQPLLSAE